MRKTLQPAAPVGIARIRFLLADESALGGFRATSRIIEG
jgi:hypothetical protein